MQAAAKLPPGQQDAMINGMVERLAARLHADGDDPDGWIRLVRSYNVLGSGERASAAVADARSALAAAPAKLSRFEDALKSLLVRPRPWTAPAPEAVAAADQMAPEQRTAMIRAMVDRLAGRLEQDGGDVEGWLRLMRSYAVLGEPTKRGRRSSMPAKPSAAMRKSCVGSTTAKGSSDYDDGDPPTVRAIACVLNQRPILLLAASWTT